MKRFILILTLIGLAGSAYATDRMELDNRIRILTAHFQALQANPAKRIPAELLNKAEGIVLMDRIKAGFLFAYQGGSGIAMVRDPKTREWSPAGFVNASEASLGFQVGGQQTFMVVLCMTTNAAVALTGNIGHFGGEASGTAGRAAAGVDSSFSTVDAPYVVFTDRVGLYGGASVKGGALSPSDEDNMKYYQAYVTMADVLYGKKVQPTESMAALTREITQDSQLANNDNNSAPNSNAPNNTAP